MHQIVKKTSHERLQCKALIMGLLLICISPNWVWGQLRQDGEPYARLYSLGPASKAVIPEIDIIELAKRDSLDRSHNIPPRFGYKHTVSFTPINSGAWIYLPDGNKVWRLRIKCPEALSVNFTFGKYHLQPGSKLYVYNSNTRQTIGAFTDLNNKGTFQNPRGFGTGLVYGNEVVVELDVPASNDGQDILEINGVVHGYRMINIPVQYNLDLPNTKTASFGSSGDCQVNISCSEGANWQNEKKGVAMILVGGTRWCTGSLINNTCNNGSPLFLTAHHCVDGDGKDADGDSNADDWTFWWNYESSTCVDPSTEPGHGTTTGAEILANRSNSDFALLRLTESPLQQNPPLDVYFNGWSRTEHPSSGGIGIHHPSGDIKKISQHQQTPESDHHCAQTSSTWSLVFRHTSNHYSAKEGGSSGSPLFMNDKRIIGQLVTGFNPDNCKYGPMCSEPSQDWSEYGKFFTSWASSSNSKRQLKAWLDDCNSNPADWTGGYYDNCSAPLVTVNSTITNARVFQAADKLTSNATITNTANVRFRANNEIELTDGFDAMQGSEFVAEIVPCTTQFFPQKKFEANSHEPALFSYTPSIILFPNPVSSGNVVTVRYQKSLEVAGQLIVYDLQGRVMQRMTLPPSDYDHNITISTPVPGAYLWRATVAGQAVGNGTLVVR